MPRRLGFGQEAAHSTRFVAVRFIRFDESEAEARFLGLPPSVRRAVADKLVAIATDPNSAVASSDVTFVAPRGRNSGRIATMVKHGRYLIWFAFRIESTADEVWVEFLDRIYPEEPKLADHQPPPEQGTLGLDDHSSN
jgi:hypothetical protein